MVAKSRKVPAKPAEPIVEAADVASEPASDPNEIENCIPGTELHLGDGRKLAFGEKAVVDPGLAAFLRERGQVK